MQVLTTTGIMGGKMAKRLSTLLILVCITTASAESRDPFHRAPKKANPNPSPAISPVSQPPPVTTPRLVGLPRLDVSGIISADRNRFAILQLDGSTRILGEGGRFRGYTVEKISSEAVVVRYRGQSFRFPLNPEFG